MTGWRDIASAPRDGTPFEQRYALTLLAHALKALRECGVDLRGIDWNSTVSLFDDALPLPPTNGDTNEG